MMRKIGRIAGRYAAAVGILGLCALLASAAIKTPEMVIQGWPARPRGEAAVMIEKYGEPNSFDENRLVWDNNGDWLKTVVYRLAPRNSMGYRGNGILEQTIPYDAPDNKIAALKSFDGRITFEKERGELSSRSENENYNYLALNLADEIVANKRSADDAREYYRNQIRLSESGKYSALMYGFSFPLRR